MEPGSTRPNLGLPRHTVIIGGGIIGASTLYFAARHDGRAIAGGNSRVTLLEASRELAPGASGKAGGFLALDWHSAATASLAQLSYRIHRQIAQEGGGAGRWGYRTVETMEVKMDSSTKGGSRCPKGLNWVDGSIVSSTSMLGSNDSTAQVTPKQLVEYLVESSQGHAGVNVRLGITAKSLEFDGDGKVNGLWIRDLEGHEEFLDCDRVVVAAGPWTGSLLEAMLPTQPPPSIPPRLLQKGRSIDGSRAHSVVFRSTRPTTHHCLFTDVRYITEEGRMRAGAPEVYPRSDGTVYICGGSDDIPLPKTADEVTYDTAQTARLIEQAKVVSPEVFGRDATVEREQACYLPGGSFNGPLVDGSPEHGLYIASGHTCWGITLGPGTGKVVTELLFDGQATSADIRMLRA